MFRLMTAKGRIENEQKSREIENLFAEPECDEVTIIGENTGEKIQGRKYRGENTGEKIHGRKYRGEKF